MNRSNVLIILLLVYIFIFIIQNRLNPSSKVSSVPLLTQSLIPVLTPTPQPTTTPSPTPRVFKPIEIYNPPIIDPAPSYTIIFVGDSMTAALGENFDELRKDLAVYYPNKVFGLFNYGFGSTNIYSVEDRLYHDSNYLGKTSPAILGRYFDIIVLESFGYNPLSQYNRQDGLTQQTETTNKILAEIVDQRPRSLIILMATIAPSKQYYGVGVTDLSPEVRAKEAEERIAYIQNQIDYAKKHNYPLINVYEKSLDKNGNAQLKYINPSDHIHPSVLGVKLISQTIADFFYQNHILPK